MGVNNRFILLRDAPCVKHDDEPPAKHGREKQVTPKAVVRPLDDMNHKPMGTLVAGWTGVPPAAD